MKIKKLSHQEVLEVCRDLNEYIKNLCPECIISINSGGTRVLDLLGRTEERREVIIKHKGTAPRIIRYLPEVITDILRWIDLKRPKSTERIIDLGDLSDLKGKKVLILDDAIETGTTIEIIRKELPQAFIAVVNNIKNHPGIDFSIYNGILIKFPWNLDYKI